MRRKVREEIREHPNEEEGDDLVSRTEVGTIASRDDHGRPLHRTTVEAGVGGRTRLDMLMGCGSHPRGKWRCKSPATIAICSGKRVVVAVGG